VQSRSTKDEGDDDGDDDADLKWSKSGEADEENDPISGSASADSDADGSGARSTAAHRAKLEAEKRRQDAAEIDGAPDKTEEEDLRQRSVHSLAYVHDVRYDQDKSTVEITLKVIVNTDIRTSLPAGSVNNEQIRFWRCCVRYGLFGAHVCGAVLITVLMVLSDFCLDAFVMIRSPWNARSC